MRIKDNTCEDLAQCSVQSWCKWNQFFLLLLQLSFSKSSFNGISSIIVLNKAVYIYTFFNPHLRILLIFFFKERERGGVGREREREKHRSVASRMHPDQGSNPQPTYMPWPGIEPAPFQCTGWWSNQLSHPVRAAVYIFLYDCLTHWVRSSSLYAQYSV